jgi:hypothetical protein
MLPIRFNVELWTHGQSVRRLGREISPVARPLPTEHIIVIVETETSMFRMRFEPTIRVPERQKAFRVSNRGHC